MQNDNIKIKLTKDELDIIYNAVSVCVSAPASTMNEKLISRLLAQIHRKLLLKWTYMLHQNTVTLNSAEALAFWLKFNGQTFKHPRALALFRSILDKIHQKYI